MLQSVSLGMLRRRAATPTATDMHWARLAVGLHFDGTGGSTTFTDEKGNSWTAIGNAQIDTGQSKFGGASLLCDGTGDGISTPHSSAFAIEAVDFTLDGWVRRAASGTMHYLASKRSDAPSTGWEWRVNASDKLQIFYTGGSILTSTASVASSQWVHLRTCRIGSTWYHFIDGALDSSGAVSNGTANTASSLRIGIDQTGSNSLNGHVDDFRMYVGIGLSAAAFVVPDRAFLHS